MPFTYLTCKKFFLFFLLFGSFIAKAQTFFVKAIEVEWSAPVIKKILEKKYLLADSAKADYVVNCVLVSINPESMGCMIGIFDRRTDSLIIKTNLVEKSCTNKTRFSIIPLIFEDIARNNLPDMLKFCTVSKE